MVKLTKSEYDKQRRARLKAERKCYRCRKYIETGNNTVHCFECKSQTKRRDHRILRNKRKLEGRCVQCGKMAESRKSQCTECLEKAKIRTKKWRNAKRKIITGSIQKQCHQCWKTKQITDFDDNKKTCIECNEYTMKKHQECQKQKQLYKKEGTCNICGMLGSENENWKIFEFDHIDPSKKEYALSKVRNTTTLHYELTKCQIVCIFCHRTRTHSMKESWLPRNNAQKTNIEYINHHKTKHGCENKDCIYSNHIKSPFHLEFDHLDEYIHCKKAPISTLRYCGKNTIKQERKKCRVLCAGCHRKRTFKQLGFIEY